MVKTWDDLSSEQQEMYIRHANYLLENEYVDKGKHKDLLELAQEIYSKQVMLLNEQPSSK